MDAGDTRTAHCTCGQLRAECRGDAVRISICHCLECKRRTGSAFGHNVTFPETQVSLLGSFTTYRRSSDDGRWVESSFCPICGVSIFYRIEAQPAMISIPGGTFEDPLSRALTPRIEVYEERAATWCRLDLSPPNDEEG